MPRIMHRNKIEKVSLDCANFILCFSFFFFLFLIELIRTAWKKENLWRIYHIYIRRITLKMLYTLMKYWHNFFFYQYFNRTCKSRFYSTIVLWKGELESLFNFPYFRIVQIKKKKKSKFIKSINFKIVTFGSRVIRYLFVGIHT